MSRPLKRSLTETSKMSVKKRKSTKKKLSYGLQMYRLQKHIHPFVMGGEFDLSINNSTGWNGTGLFSLVFAFTQAGVVYSIGGASYSTAVTYTNASSLASVFDEYRMDKVYVDVYFSNNNSSINSPTVAFPILFAVIDYDDGNGLANANQALAYSSCKTMQLGNSSGQNNGRQTILLDRPAVQTSVQLTNFTGTTATAKLDHSPWMDTDTNNAEHNSVKFWLEPVNGTSSAVGYVTFVFRGMFSYRNTK